MTPKANLSCPNGGSLETPPADANDCPIAGSAGGTEYQEVCCGPAPAILIVTLVPLLVQTHVLLPVQVVVRRPAAPTQLTVRRKLQSSQADQLQTKPTALLVVVQIVLQVVVTPVRCIAVQLI